MPTDYKEHKKLRLFMKFEIKCTCKVKTGRHEVSMHEYNLLHLTQITNYWKIINSKIFDFTCINFSHEFQCCGNK